ncbi:YjbF family lipoprotein [Gammaproteobacteria bacterium]|nr:YjbF family lipoprotein [Gammaproteobacteria bacterium]
MKNILLYLSVISLISCTSIDSSRIAPGYTQAFSSIKNIFFGYEDNIDIRVINKIPYASMLVRIGKGPPALMILESVSNNNYTWVSADGIYLVTNKGRIIKTSGLPNNLKDEISSFEGWDKDIYNDLEFYSYLTFDKPVLKNLRVSSKYKKEDKQSINLASGSKYLYLVEQTISSPDIAWLEKNMFWVDDLNYPWKSKQYISPKLPPIYLEVTKKPR